MDQTRIENEMKEAFDFLFTKKTNIRSIIQRHSNIYDVMETISEVFDDEYLLIYPDNYTIFNAINDEEFFEWCQKNIEGFQGGEIESAPQFWCGIKKKKDGK